MVFRCCLQKSFLAVLAGCVSTPLDELYCQVPCSWGGVRACTRTSTFTHTRSSLVARHLMDTGCVRRVRNGYVSRWSDGYIVTLGTYVVEGGYKAVRYHVTPRYSERNTRRPLTESLWDHTFDLWQANGQSCLNFRRRPPWSNDGGAVLGSTSRYRSSRGDGTSAGSRRGRGRGKIVLFLHSRLLPQENPGLYGYCGMEMVRISIVHPNIPHCEVVQRAESPALPRR